MKYVEMIFSSGGNARFTQLAISKGWLAGSQLPKKNYHPLHFADQDYRNPNRRKYMEALALYRPQWATVIDIEKIQQVSTALAWAEEASQYVQCGIIFIPKVRGSIEEMPRDVNGKEVRLGYSVPTSVGGTPLKPKEFAGWKVHILGGDPRKQRMLADEMDVASFDNNYIQKKAMYGQWFNGEGWETLPREENDGPYRALERSFDGVGTLWGRA